MYRSTGASGTTDLSRLSAAESAEHQAKVFASAFLIHEGVVVTLASPAEISEQFGVSLEAAEISFERVKERERAKEHVRLTNERFQADMQPPEQQLAYFERVCPECQRSMLRISFGLLCLECGYSENSE
jgi:Zn-dependent peptidase ImmA (M78 family)